MIITKENLIKIGYAPSKDNAEVYIRGNEMWNFKPSMVGFMKSIMDDTRPEGEAKREGEEYLKFKARIEKEIKEKLGIK